MKQQLIFTGGGLVLLLSLFFFGRTASKKEASQLPATESVTSFDIQQHIQEEKKHLKPSQVEYLTALENSIGRGDVIAQQIKADTLIANFWRDSANHFEPYIYYLSAASKLENSEKNLTFAARLLAGYLRNEQDPAKKVWMADQAIELFEKAILLNPADKNYPVEMGSCYVFGYAAAGRADKAMKGILDLKAIADKDTLNAKANVLVGVGGVISGQYDKAITRLQRVVNNDPSNIEAMSYLAEAYAGKGDRETAIKWLETSKKIADNPEFNKAVDQRIKELK